MSKLKVCPKCNHPEVFVLHMDSDEDVAWQRVTCGKCYCEWNEIFNFSHCEDLDGKILGE